MKCLLDTHVLLWILSDDKRLSVNAKNNFLDPENTIYLSVASIWEISIKISLKKLKLKTSLEKIIDDYVIGNDINLLNIESSHIYPLQKLPFHHQDPFDRVILCQAKYEKMPIISSDKNFDLYSVERIW
jgi:PIN domain nuclease of toxin-antitoxin system